MIDNLERVVIIGAGLGGCALALALSQHGVRPQIYESRPEKASQISSGVILTPNGLQVLDRLGVLARIEDRCYKITHRVFKNGKDETTRKNQTSGPPLYDYANHRVWRRILLGEMKVMLSERDIDIKYNSKFQEIISESKSGVEFSINGEKKSASLLIGMDGIFSTVRKYIASKVTPEYTGTIGVLSHIKRSSVSWPYEDYEWNATIQDKPGAVFFIAEDPQGEVIMIGKQKREPEYSREQLDDLQKDKDKLVAFYREDYAKWGPTARSIIDSVVANKEEAFIWPFLKVPTLQRWYSDSGRVVLCGDAAHGLPPSSGQGINQALEDIYSLTLLLTASRKSTDNGVDLLDALEYWQKIRQQRVDAVFDWATNSTNVQRLPEAERKRLLDEGRLQGNDGDEMRWLYEPRLEDDVNAFLQRNQV